MSLVFLCVLLAGEVRSAVRIEAPAEAPQGSAVLIRLISDAAVPAVTLRWQDATFAVPVLADAGGWIGSVLVPMPLEGGAAITLWASVGKSSATAEIRPLGVNWPRQELKVEKKYVSPPVQVQKRIEDEQRRVKAVLARITPERYWSMPCTRPVPGAVSGAFGEQRVFNGQPRSRHRGLDLRAAMGDPVQAMADGKVVLAEEQYFSGNVVFLDHGLGLFSMYAHLSAIHVAVGETVRAGQAVGLIGATGRVTGPHLHWGVSILNKPVDPLSLVSVRMVGTAGTR